jgi:murein DD-endopeptidase MepM/ murein hydrolase activator NlpD
LKKGDHFTRMLIEENAHEINGFEAWIFCRGMMFDSKAKWWGDRGRRDHPHEGIDFCVYKNNYQEILRLDTKIRIPVMHGGVVKAISKDYLGKTIVIEHDNPGSPIKRFVSFYGHTEPLQKVDLGVRIKEGDVIAAISETGSSKSNILPHLHFSVGIPSDLFSYDEYIWDAIRAPSKIVLIDPLSILDMPYQSVEAGDPACRPL